LLAAEEIPTSEQILTADEWLDSPFPAYRAAAQRGQGIAA